MRGQSLILLSWRGQGKQPNRIYLKDNKVLSIEIQLDYELTLEEVVDMYGPPEYIYAYFYGVESQGYEVKLDYPAQGLGFTSDTFPIRRKDYTVDVGVGVLSQDLLVTEVFYFAPTSMEGMLSDVFLQPSDRVEDYLTNGQKWKGFGSVRLAE
jgi:hypothetical protein